MNNRKKEAAKFFAGWEALETVMHFSFNFSDSLPIDFGIITLTQATNNFGMVFSPIVVVFLVYYAWFKE